MSSSGQLILLRDGEITKEVVYEPVNWTLHVGSDKLKTNACLTGLRDLAFSIYIDSGGRVCIRFHMKRIFVNGKRAKQHSGRPLHNNTIIEAGTYKFIWKYNQRLFRSYSFPSLVLASKSMYDDEDVSDKNRRTINCLAVAQSNDENAALTVDGEPQTNNSKTPEPMPAIKTEASDNGKSATKRRTSLIPVKPNRTSELRRSMVRSKSMCHEPMPFQCRTPKRPIPSAAMSKSVHAIMHSESRLRDNRPSLSARKSLGNFPKMIDGLNLFNVVTDEMRAVGPSKYVTQKFGATNSPKRTPKKGLVKPKRLSLRSELTELGLLRANAQDIGVPSEDRQQAEANVTLPSTPVNAKSTSTSAANVTFTPEANVLPSEKDSTSISAVDNGIAPKANITFPGTPEANVLPSEKDSTNISAVDNGIAPEAKATFPGTPEANVLPSEKDSTNISAVDNGIAPEANLLPSEKDSTNISAVDNGIAPEANVTLPGTPEANVSPSEKDSTNISVVENVIAPEANVTLPGTPKANVLQSIRESMNSLATFTPELYRLMSSSSVEIIESDESYESEDSVISVDDDSELYDVDASPDIIDGMKRESINNDKSTTEDCTEIQPSEQLNTPPEDSSEKSLSGSQLSSVSTPTKILPIRARRNSRPCSLYECCSPSTTFSTPTKSKMANNVVSTPRSILKTPKATKTPKKTVRILEELHEEEDDGPKTNNQSVDAQTSVIDLFVQNETETESPQISVDPNDVHRESISMDGSDDVFEPIDNKRELTELSNETCNKDCDSLTISSSGTLVEKSAVVEPPIEVDTPALTETPLLVERQTPVEVDTPALTKMPLLVERQTPMEVDTPALTEMPLVFVAPVEAEQSNDEADVIDETTNVSGQCGDTDVINETKADELTSSANNREETSLFDETFEIYSDCSSTSVIDEMKNVDETRGEEQLLNTPKPFDKTNLVGVKELLNTPEALNETADLRGVREILKTPKVLDRTNCVGLKELLNTPEALNETADLRGVREILKTPKELDRTNCVGLKELLNTPEALNKTADMRGVRELLKTPKDLDRTNCVGLKELLQTPDALNETADMRGVRELLKTPKDLNRTNCVGLKELLQTPDALNKTADMRGIREMLKTPKRLEQTSFVGVKELLKTPCNREDSHLEGVHELQKSPDAPVAPMQDLPNSSVAPVEPIQDLPDSTVATVEPNQADQSTANADKKFKLLVKYNSRQSLIALVNNQLEPAVAVPAPVQPMAVPVEALPVETVPVEAVPVEAVPVEAVPVEAVPVEAVPVEAVPVEAVPVEAVPVEAVPVEAVPVEAVPVEAVPVEALPVEAVPVEALPVEAVPVEAVLVEAVPVEAVPVEIVPVEAVPVESKVAAVSVDSIELPAQQDGTNAVETKKETSAGSKIFKSENNQSFRKNETTEPGVEAEASNDNVNEKSEDKVKPSALVHPKTESKFLDVPRKNRSRQTSAVEAQESQDESTWEKNESAEATTVPSKVTVASKVSKTPNRTRKRKASVVDRKEQDVSEDDEAEEETAEASKSARSVARTRRGKASAAEDEKVSETEDPKPGKSKAAVKIEKTPSRTRKAAVKAPESPDENVLESDEAMQATPLESKVVTRKRIASVPASQASVPKTRKRKASQVDWTEADYEIDSDQVNTEKSSIALMVPKTRNRAASAAEPLESKEKVGTKVASARKRKAAVAEPTEKNTSANLTMKAPRNHLTSQKPIRSWLNDDAKSTRSGKRAAPKDPPKKTGRNTRAAKNAPSDMDQQESHDDNPSESSQATEADSELLSDHAESIRSGKRAAPKDPPKKAGRSTRAAKNASK
ncbi:hypothetical protein HA402_015513 [Bradysia odoriphaga]|nr:hypothetical protein HA402_015513 [Bradysia odoriphaga]